MTEASIVKQQIAIEAGFIYFSAAIRSRAELDIPFRKHIRACLMRHENGDFGEISDNNKIANSLNIKTKGRIQSVFKSDEFPEIVVLTADCWTSTAILFLTDCQKNAHGALRETPPVPTIFVTREKHNATETDTK